MNPLEIYDNAPSWQSDPDVIFYEPRTFPAGWDLSEYLPAYSQIVNSANFDFLEDPSNP